MTNHVSRATAELMRQAGWQHELQPGDWVLWCPSETRQQEAIILALEGEEEDPERLAHVGWVGFQFSQPVFAADCLHLPTATDLLTALMAAGCLIGVTTRAWEIASRYDCWVVRYGNDEWVGHASLAEAAALAWLAAAQPADNPGQPSAAGPEGE
jgi:hypothetical protein